MKVVKGIFLAHIIKPSTKKGQLYDVFIYLLRHKSDDFSDVKYAEFFLGPYWKIKSLRRWKKQKVLLVFQHPLLALSFVLVK